MSNEEVEELKEITIKESIAFIIKQQKKQGKF